MARTTKVQLPNGEERDALELDFEIGNEQWNEYKLLDGGRIRLKTTALKIFRVLDNDGKPAYASDGEPLMFIRHNTQVVATD